MSDGRTTADLTLPAEKASLLGKEDTWSPTAVTALGTVPSDLDIGSPIKTKKAHLSPRHEDANQLQRNVVLIALLLVAPLALPLLWSEKSQDTAHLAMSTQSPAGRRFRLMEKLRTTARQRFGAEVMEKHWSRMTMVAVEDGEVSRTAPAHLDTAAPAQLDTEAPARMPREAAAATYIPQVMRKLRAAARRHFGEEVMDKHWSRMTWVGVEDGEDGWPPAFPVSGSA